MNAVQEQIAPEIVQAIIAQAAGRGLSVNDYLRQVLGLTNGAPLADAAPVKKEEETGAQTLTPYERVKHLIGSIDSSVPDPDPAAQPRPTQLGQMVAEKLKKQGLKIP